MKKLNKKLKMFILYFIAFVVIAWTIATYYVEQEGPPLIKEYGPSTSEYKALIIFDPDPIYNLDEQVCGSIALGLETQAWNATVISVAKLPDIDPTNYGLYVFCANTYNWSPDRAITNLVKEELFYVGKKVAAITLGSGSTKRSSRKLVELIKNQNCNLIDAKEIWLMKPNDEEDLKSSNVQVARDKAEEWGVHLSTLAR